MPKHSEEIVLLLDGNALLHRAWHALPPLTTKDGRVVNAAYGFAMVLEKMLEEYQPAYMVVAWDLPGKTFRHEKYVEYKATREKKEQELYDQIPIIQGLLSTFGIPSVSLPGFEGDDIIGTLSKMAEKKGLRAYILTGDMDSLQLVTDKTHVIGFVKGMSETKEYDEAAVKEKYGLFPAQLIDFKTLRGDPSDNIPGLQGIGEKTATELLQKHKTVEGIFCALKNHEIPEKFSKKLEGKEQAAELMRELVTIVRDLSLEFDWKDAKVSPPDWSKILPLYQELEFRSLLRKHAGEAQVEPKKLKKKGGLEISISEGAWNEKTRDYWSHLAGKTVSIAVFEKPADLFGVSSGVLAILDRTEACVIFSPKPEACVEAAKALEKAAHIITHDLKRLMRVVPLAVDGRFKDLMIASYLLHSGSKAHDLASVLQETLKGIAPAIPTTFEKKNAVGFADVVAVFPSIFEKLMKQMKENGMGRVFEEIEMPLVPVLFEMETEGIRLDVKALQTFAKTIRKRIEACEKKIIELAGTTFNVASPSQLADILFSKLDISTKGIKKTQTGYSTAASELEKLEDAHPIIPLISEYRELAKLESTYVLALPVLVQKDGRIHTTFNQAVTTTGRLSSSEPNLQNIPIRSDLGNEIRKAFIADKGKRLIAADYAQIELRLVAEIAKDEAFLQAFREGADIHTRTASQVWNIPESKVTPDQRQSAKAINFGILYGMGSRALARSTGMSFDEAQEFIDRYFSLHPALQTYMDATKLQAHEKGYVETPFGRRRYLPEIESGVPQLVAAAERMAINMPVQGAEADIVKMAMIAIHKWLETSKLPARLLLQVHDELVLEVDEDAINAVARGVKELMEDVVKLDVPLAAEVEVGKNWGEMQEWKNAL